MGLGSSAASTLVPTPLLISPAMGRLAQLSGTWFSPLKQVMVAGCWMAGATGVMLAEHSARAWSTECRVGRGAVVLGRPPQVICLLSNSPQHTAQFHWQITLPKPVQVEQHCQWWGQSWLLGVHQTRPPTRMRILEDQEGGELRTPPS